MSIITIEIPELTEKDKDRFWGKVRKSNSGGCWEWAGGKSHPYGRIKIKGKYYYAHRVSWFIANGAIPPGKLVCHSCDNHFCCYDGHFFLGTTKENMKDAVKKGRMAKGESHSNGKLTEINVLEIRKRYLEGETQTSIASDFKVGQTQISHIVSRSHWSHI